jgi:hypothetical protein
MSTARAPWAGKYIATIKNAFSYAESIEDPNARAIALNSLNGFYEAYGEMGYYGHAFQNMESTFNTGDMVIDMNLSGVEKLLPAFKRSVYDLTRGCSQRGIDPSIFFDHSEIIDYAEFGAECMKEETGMGFPGMLTPSAKWKVQDKLDSENYRHFHS